MSSFNSCASSVEEKKMFGPQFLRRASALLFLCVLILHCHYPTVECQDRVFFRRLSSSRAPEFKIGIQRIVLSIALGILTGLISAILFAFLIRAVVIYLNKTPILKGPVVFSPKISPKTLQSALANENLLLGSSPNGKYYKTVLDNGLTVAVKRLEPFETGSGSPKSDRRRIQRELEVLAGLRHENLMSLRAYVREQDMFSVVYDYVPSGSLEDVMNRVREDELELDWDIRLRIAIGVIKGLRYLHFTCSPQILHLNLKPRNVMLDREFKPRLADCGLANLIPNSGRAATSKYSAPECLQNSSYTDKSDVYSFGMILGFLLTGKDPTNPFLSEASGRAGTMGNWLRELQQAGDAKEALDKRILGEEVEEGEMLMAVRIAVVCLSDMPADRPSSDELVPMLTQLHSF